MSRYMIFPRSQAEQVDLLVIINNLKIKRHRIRDDYFAGKASFKNYRLVLNTIRAYKTRLRQLEKVTGRRAAA